MSGGRSSAMALGLAIVLLVAGGLAASPGQTARAAQAPHDDPVGALEAGRLLVASRRVINPTFGQSVVLLFAHSSDGAGGLIVNRPTVMPVERLLPDLPGGSSPSIFFGGAVGVDSVRALLRLPVSPVAGRQVLPGLHLLGTTEALASAVEAGATAGQLKVYVGYAGWSPGQLEQEIRRGDWHVFDGETAVVFDADPGTLWRRWIAWTDRMAL